MGRKKYIFALFLLILILFIITRFILLFGPLQYMDADRAVEGIMAKHILERGERPFFLYGVHYCGSCALSAYTASMFFSLFGINVWSFNLAAIFVSLVLLVIVFFFLRRFFNDRVALISVLLMIFSLGGFARINVNNPSYMFVILANVILLVIFYFIFFDNRRSYAMFFLFGLTSIISFWVLEVVIPLLFLMLVFWYISDKRFLIKKESWVYCLAVFIGAIPLIIYNINNKFAHIKHIFAETPLHHLVCKYNLLPGLTYCLDEFKATNKNLVTFFFEILPGFFDGYIYYVFFLLALVLVTYIYRKDIYKIIRGLIPAKGSSVDLFTMKGEVFIIVYVWLYLLLYYFRGMGKPNYMLFGYVFIIFVLSFFIDHLLIKGGKTRARLMCYASYLFLAAFVVVGAISTMSLKTDDEQASYPELAEFLESKDINYLYTDFLIKWPVIFYSNEEIVASCDGMCFCLGEGRRSKYPAYEEAVNKSDSFAYVVRKNSPFENNLKDSLADSGAEYSSNTIGNLVIYNRIPEHLRPKAVVPNCDDINYWMGLPP